MKKNEVQKLLLLMVFTLVGFNQIDAQTDSLELMNVDTIVGGTIVLSPQEKLHDISSYIIGVNRNHVASEATQAEMDTMLNKYGRIKPAFGNGKKIYRLGHLVTDGIGPYDGYIFDQHFNQAGPYPYDDISYGLEEAAQMDADVTMVVNFAAENAVQKAADLVSYLRNSGYIDLVKYFEIGNEVGFFLNKGHCDYACTAEEYADRLNDIVNAMKSVDPTLELTIGAAISASSDWAGFGCSDFEWSCGDNEHTPSVSWGEPEQIVRDLLDAAAPNVDFLIYHGYISYPIGVAVDARLNVVTDTDMGKAMMAQNDWNVNMIQNRIEPIIEEYELEYNKEISIANTEYFTHLSAEEGYNNVVSRANLVHGTLEGMFTADNMITAAKLDLEMAVNFSFFHKGYDIDHSSNIFFVHNNPNNVKPAFQIHKLIAENLGTTVVSSNGIDLPQSSTINFWENALVGCGDPYCNPNNRTPYSSITYVATERPNGTIAILILNRTNDQDITLDFNPNSTVISSRLLGYKGDGFTDKTMDYFSETIVDLSAVTIPHSSVCVLEIIPETTASCSIKDVDAIVDCASGQVTFQWETFLGANGHQLSLTNESTGAVYSFNIEGSKEAQQEYTTSIGFEEGATYLYTISNNEGQSYTSTITIECTSCNSMMPNPVITQISGNTLFANWQNLPNAYSYELRYRPASSSVWTTMSTDKSSLYLNNLQANTAYQIMVRYICSSGTSSWSYDYTTTLFDECGRIENAMMTNLVGSTVTLDWSAYANANDEGYEIVYRPFGGTWQSAFTTEPIVILNEITANSTYEYYIRTFCSAGCTNWSPQLYISMPFFREVEETKLETNVYPNPARNDLTIALGAIKENAAVTIEVYNMQGQRLIQKEITSSYNGQKEVLDIAFFTSGIYWVKVNSEEGQQTFKITKL